MCLYVTLQLNSSLLCVELAVDKFVDEAGDKRDDSFYEM